MKPEVFEKVLKKRVVCNVLKQSDVIWRQGALAWKPSDAPIQYISASCSATRRPVYKPVT